MRRLSASCIFIALALSTACQTRDHATIRDTGATGGTGGSGSDTGSGSGSGSGGATDPAALAAAAHDALDRNCTSCHGPSAPAATNGSIDFFPDLQKIVDNGKVKRGDKRLKSRILVRILDGSDPMPPVKDASGNPTGLVMSPADVAAVQNWVAADSPVP